MAGISRDLTLVDKFTSVWDKFIGKAEKAEKSVSKVEESVAKTEQVADAATGAVYRWTNAIGHMNKSAMLAVYSFKELVDQGYLVEEVAAKTEDLGEKVEETGEKTEKTGEQATKAIDKVEKKTSKLMRTLTRLGVMLFGLRKVVQAVRNAAARVPDEVIKPFNDLKQLLQDDLARVTTSLFKGMQKGLDRLNEALNSPAARNFVAVLQVGFEAIGNAIGFVAEKVADFMDFLAGNLERMQINFSEVGEFIGKVFGVVYVTVHNIFATMYNFVASIAEGIANAFRNPAGVIIGIMKGVFNVVMDILNTAAKAIDWVFGSNISAGLESFQTKVDNFLTEQYGPKGITLERKEIIDYGEYTARFGAAGAGYGSRIQGALRGEEALNAIKSATGETAGNTRAIKNAVTDEDLKMLIDVATQKFVSNVNLTAQTPVITVNGANTGNSDADRRALANAIKDILVEQMASGSTTGYYAYAGV